MADRNDMLDIVSKCHDATLGRATWTEALDDVAGFFGATAATLEVFGKPGFDLQFFQHHGMPDTVPDDYLRHFAQVNPRIRHGMMAPVGQIVHDHQHIDEREMDRSEFYADFLRPMGLRYYFATNLANGVHELSGLSIQRSKRQGHAENRDVSCMKALAPHVAQALDVHRRLSLAIGWQKSLREGTEWLPDAMVLLDRDCRVVHANSAARSIFRRNDGLTCERGQLAAATPELQKSLMQRISETAAGGEAFAPVSASPITVRRPSGKPPYIIAIRPIAPGRRTVQQAPSVAVFVRDPCRNAVLRPEILKSHYGLTAAEAALAVAIVEGEDLRGYAGSRGISVNTARSQLTKVMQKFDVRRQADLVRVLKSLTEPANRAFSDG